MGEIAIERARAEQVQLLQETAVKAYMDHYIHLWHDEGNWYTKNFLSAERLTLELNDPNAVFYLAYYNTNPVGFLKLNIVAPLEDLEDKNAMELERIYLTKTVIGKGIGRELVQVALKVARENNKTIVWLKAMDTSGEAIAFYKNMGFEIAGTYQLKHAMMKEELKGMVIMKRAV